MSPDRVRITAPVHGDILNRHDGKETGDELTIEVRGNSPDRAAVTVNGVPAATDGGSFCCSVPLRERKTTLAAQAATDAGAMTDSITVLWDKASHPRYRFSVDDNIEFLCDLGTAPQDYASLFDHWYLAFWRGMHEQFGAKIHINIYYQTMDQRFNLTQMPDRWQDEWIANSDWLHLSFHALQNEPSRIYKDATYDQIAHDFELVMGEVFRFASDAVTSTETTVHWAEAPKDACRALHDRGIRELIGIFHRKSDKPRTTGYYLDATLGDHIATRDCWYDPDTDLTFVECDQVVNGFQLGDIVPWLEQQASSPHTAECLELLIHEQYFREELVNFQPDVKDKVVRALTWVTERGYEPTFWSDGFVGNTRGWLDLA